MSNLIELSLPVDPDQLVLVGQAGFKLTAYNASDGTAIFKPVTKLKAQQAEPEVPAGAVDFSKHKQAKGEQGTE